MGPFFPTSMLESPSSYRTGNMMWTICYIQEWIKRLSRTIVFSVRSRSRLRKICSVCNECSRRSATVTRNSKYPCSLPGIVLPAKQRCREQSNFDDTLHLTIVVEYKTDDGGQRRSGTKQGRGKDKAMSDSFDNKVDVARFAGESGGCTTRWKAAFR